MATVATFEQNMVGMIDNAIKTRVHEIFEERIKEAQEKIDMQIRKELGAIVLSIARHYSVQMDRGEIKITLKNEMAPK